MWVVLALVRGGWLCSVTQSIIFYGAPVLSGAMKYQKLKQILDRVMRKIAIRICSAYRTIFTHAVAALARLQVETRERLLERWQERFLFGPGIFWARVF